MLIVDFDESNGFLVCVKFVRTSRMTVSGSSELIFDPPTQIHVNDLQDLLLKNADGIIHYHDLTSDTWKKVKPIQITNGNRILFEDLEDPTKKYQLKTYMEFKEQDIVTSYTLIKPRFTDAELSAISNSFSARLTYSGKVQNTLITEYLCKSASIFSGGSVYAPYAVLCQSSGFGKSRGVCETGRKLASIYGVCRKSNDTGFPSQTNWLNELDSFIDKANEVDIPRNESYNVSNYKVGRALIFLNCLMSAFEAWFRTLVDDKLLEKKLFAETFSQTNLEKNEIEKLSNIYDFIIDSYVNGSDGVKVFEEYLRTLIRSYAYCNLTINQICNNILLIADKFVHLNKIVFKHKNELDKNIWSEFIQTHFNQGPSANSEESEKFHRIWPSENQESFPFLLILDEALILNELTRCGISTLTIIRRALHFIPPTKSFLVVTLGTSCDLITMNKPVYDESLRFIDRRYFLFPLILTGNWDIFAKESKLSELVIDGNFLRNHRTQLLSCTFGRALWSSFYIHAIIENAVAKLRNGFDNIYSATIASWCIRVGLTVHADSKLSEKLLRSHMATLLAVLTKSDRVIVSYSSEPILAIAARQFIKQETREQYFGNLLKFVEGVPNDRDEIGISVFSEILLQAMDKSKRITTVSKKNPPGASETVLKILKTQKYLLEDSNDQTFHDSSDRLVDEWCKDYHHVTNLENYLKSLYSDSVFEKLKSFIPATLLQGLLNFSQFIKVHRHFPYELFFEDEFEELTGASGDDKKECNIFDKAMLRAGLLRKVAYGCPLEYYGLDAVIPILLEVDVEVTVEVQAEGGKSVERVLGLHKTPEIPQKRSEVATGTEVRTEIKRKSVYSFIGVKFKIGREDKIEALSKTDPFIHLNTLNYESWEIQAIKENFLVLVLSSENDAEKSQLSTERVDAVSEPYSFTVFNHGSAPKTNDFYQYLNKSFYQLGGMGEKQFKLQCTLQDPEIPVTFSQVKIAPHLNICGFNWSEGGKHTCLLSSSLLAFKTLLGDEIVDMAHQIIRTDESIFNDQIDPFVLKTTADAVLNTNFANFPNSDPLLRESRDQTEIPPVLPNFNHWRKGLNVDNTPAKKIHKN